MIVELEQQFTIWECPNCDMRDRTSATVANRFHDCPGLAGMYAPLVPEGLSCKVEAHEREDYVGDELLRYDSCGRPIMSVETTRDDGNDLVVFPGTAQASLRAYS